MKVLACLIWKPSTETTFKPIWIKVFCKKNRIHLLNSMKTVILYVCPSVPALQNLS